MQIHPNRRRWINRKLTYIGGAVAALLMLGLAVHYKKNGDVRSVDISFADAGERQFLNDREVRNYLFKEMGVYLEGATVFSVEPRKIEQILERNPFVQKADAYISALNSLKIRIIQRNPIVRIEESDGKRYYLDASGAMMPTSPNFAARVPVATGFTGRFNENWRSIENNVTGQIFALATFLSEDPFFGALVEQIHIQSDGDFLLVPKLGDFLINIGPPTDLHDKFKRIKGFYQQALPNLGWNRYRAISVKFKGQIIGEKK
jgi:cell division protein FtsQ